MTTFPYLAPWLQCLLRLVPPSGLVHVGAGGGSALPYPFASMPRLLAVEAEAAPHASLQAQLKNHAHCQVVQAVVADEPGIANYYTQSQSNENGLCPPANLRALWPNIKAVRTEQLPTTTLQILLDQAPGGASAFNWAVIDCLPAGDVVRGAGTLPGTWDVVVVRTLNDAASATDSAAYALSLQALTQQLSAFGLEFVAMAEENHPRMVRALFVRNSAQELEHKNAKLIADYDQLARATAELTAQRDTETQAKLEALAQRDSLAQEKLKLIADYDQLTRARDQLSLEREAISNERNQLATAKDEQTLLATQRQQALTAAQQEATSLQQRIQQLEAEAQQTNYRQQLQQEEMIKAEAQIELIKDLLLREPGL